MPVKVEFPFMRGTCSLKIDNQAPTKISCFLDFEAQRLECYPETDTTFSLLGGKRDQSYKVTDLELDVPSGTLCAAEVPIAFAASIKGGNLSSYRTSLTHRLAINAGVGVLSFVINEKLVFQIENGEHERLFFPGYDLVGSIDIGDGLSICGAKDYISLIGECKKSTSDISVALGISIGAPVQLFATQTKDELELYLNNFGTSHKARPIISTGIEWRDLDLSRKNLIEAFHCARTYSDSLTPAKRSGMKNAVMSFLEGRVLNGSYELKLLAAFHFLEWFDGTRRLSPNGLMNRLGIDRNEADGICLVRNDSIHNRRLINEIVQDGLCKIAKSNSDRIQKIPNVEPGLAFMNYLYTLLGDTLMREIGYKGGTQPYYPI